ncbi:DsbA family oxidoreductase [Brevibacillus sp. B_LB10_24]|uniref:DsbA family oxidoreductase n=1 Tax=Brevibacillus sp. B_LB10_24 TaxID=3380645 RepID=UPI0038B954DF
MIIDIFQDTICPWCRIGKKHLFDALQQWNGKPASIRYRSYMLDPNTPEAGHPFREAMLALTGTPQALDRMLEHVTAAGAASGLTFHFDRVDKKPNTLASHQLIKLAPDEKTGAVVDAIYQAYFEAGLDIGDLDVLAKIAEQQGMDGNELKALIQSGAKQAEIEQDLQYARQLQISGVPFFVIDNQLALSGAHPVETFLKAFEKVNSPEKE